MPRIPANSNSSNNATATDDSIVTVYAASQIVGKRYQSLRSAYLANAFKTWYENGKLVCRLGDVKKYIANSAARRGNATLAAHRLLGQQLFDEVASRGAERQAQPRPQGTSDNDALRMLLEQVNRQRTQAGEQEIGEEEGESLPPYDHTEKGFGVEIEIVGACRLRNSTDAEMNAREVLTDNIIQELCRAGVPTKFGKYSEFDAKFWMVKVDQSCGLELVSPPLYGKDGEAQIKKVCKILQTVGAKVDNKCSTHIHWDVKEGSLDFFKRLMVLYHRYEGAIDRIMQPSRRGTRSSYARSLRSVTPGQIIAATTLEELYNLYLQDRPTDNNPNVTIRECRSVKVNVSKYPTSGTVEFRQHGGTLNAAKIIAWMHLTGKMIDYAKGVKPIRSGGDFKSLALMIGLDKELTEYYEARIAELAA